MKKLILFAFLILVIASKNIHAQSDDDNKSEYKLPVFKAEVLPEKLQEQLKQVDIDKPEWRAYIVFSSGDTSPDCSIFKLLPVTHEVRRKDFDQWYKNSNKNEAFRYLNRIMYNIDSKKLEVKKDDNQKIIKAFLKEKGIDRDFSYGNSEILGICLVIAYKKLPKYVFDICTKQQETLTFDKRCQLFVLKQNFDSNRIVDIEKYIFKLNDELNRVCNDFWKKYDCGVYIEDNISLEKYKKEGGEYRFTPKALAKNVYGLDLFLNTRYQYLINTNLNENQEFNSRLEIISKKLKSEKDPQLIKKFEKEYKKIQKQIQKNENDILEYKKNLK